MDLEILYNHEKWAEWLYWITLKILKICDFSFKNLSFSKNDSNRNLIFELVQGIMVLKLVFKFQINPQKNEHDRVPLTIIKNRDLKFKDASISQEKFRQNRNLIFKIIQCIIVMKLAYKFQIDRVRNECDRVPISICLGRTY